VLFTREAAAWYRSLSDRQADRLDATLDALQDRGPDLGRPLADRIHGARHHKLKELRPPSTNLRALFAFTDGRAIVLTGGDKTNNWDGFYREHVRIADRLLDQHERGIDPWPKQRTGARSEARGR
jgi:hypothetical protein